MVMVKDEVPEQVGSEPDITRISGETQAIVRVVIGTNPQEPLDKYGLAQDAVSEARKRQQELQSEIAQLKARYWSSGTNPSQFDLERKILLAEITEAERTRLLSEGQKVTESGLESFAHASPKYKTFVEQAGKDRITLEVKMADLGKHNNAVAAALGAVDYYEKAVRISEEYLRFARRTHDT